MENNKNIKGSYFNIEMYKFLNLISNSVGQTITEYHWREACYLIKTMEDNKLVEIELKILS